MLSSTSRPDFVAVLGDRRKLVMVEIKNAKTAGTKPDKFQATFYNTVGAKVWHNGNGGIQGALVT